jgi:hypothetical protein
MKLFQLKERKEAQGSVFPGYQSGVSDPDAYCLLPNLCPYASADPTVELPISKMGPTRACSGADSGRTRADEEEASAKSATLAKPVIRTILLEHQSLFVYARFELM